MTYITGGKTPLTFFFKKSKCDGFFFFSFSNAATSCGIVKALVFSNPPIKGVGWFLLTEGFGMVEGERFGLPL